MPNYLESVLARHAVQVAQRSEKTIAIQREWEDRLTPLETRLERLLRSLPPEIAEQGVALESIRRLLAGKWRGNCHPGELGAVLRKSNWVRRRCWSDSASGFRSLWFKETK
jgi:hypothetical protein